MSPEDMRPPREVPEGYVPLTHDVGFARFVGPIYQKVEGEHASLGFHVEEHHCNPAMICHGGMLMTVLDMAIGWAVIAKLQTAKFVPSVNNTYDFIRPARIGEWLYSDMDFVHTTRRTGFANGYLIGPEGPVVRTNGIVKIPGDDNPLFKRMAGG